MAFSPILLRTSQPNQMRIRLIYDGARDGCFNMAADQWLLDWSNRTGTPALRFYAWSEPTLSLGYFQSIADRQQHPPSRQCEVVRRASGGGAILHHHELTYAYSAPIADRLVADVATIYDVFHKTLVQILATFGIAARLADKHDVAIADNRSLLCFDRRSIGDVVLNDYKIAGSAQRRSSGAVLQHGSILLRSSPFAPHLLGISDLSKRLDDRDTLTAAWLEGLQNELNATWESVPFSESEQQQIELISDQRFRSTRWINRR